MSYQRGISAVKNNDGEKRLSYPGNKHTHVKATKFAHRPPAGLHWFKSGSSPCVLSTAQERLAVIDSREPSSNRNSDYNFWSSSSSSPICWPRTQFHIWLFLDFVFNCNDLKIMWSWSFISLYTYPHTKPTVLTNSQYLQPSMYIVSKLNLAAFLNKLYPPYQSYIHMW